MGRILLSICAVVVAVGLAASAQQPPQAQQHPAQEDSAASQGTPVGIAEPERNREGGGNQGNAQDQPSPLERDDLTAQQAMALFAGLQVLLTGAGLMYIRWTLEATREAVREAQEATGLAETAFRSQHENARRELRAYVTVDVEKAGPFRIGQKPCVRMIIRNTGQTPARDLCVFGKVAVRIPSDIGEMDVVSYDVPTVVLGAGSSITRERTTLKPLTSEQLQMISVGTRALICAGLVTYVDVFGDKQETRFAVHFNSNDDLPRFHKGGNTAT